MRLKFKVKFNRGYLRMVIGLLTRIYSLNTIDKRDEDHATNTRTMRQSNHYESSDGRRLKLWKLMQGSLQHKHPVHDKVMER